MLNAAEWPKKFIVVEGKRMACVEMGKGDPIIFQHGNPTSSYLWRNIMPQLVGQGRCIAIDLIGMGDSDKLDDSGPDKYTLAEHQHYLDLALEALDVGRRVTWVIHDWGSALGFDWCRRHASRVRGICYMEGIVMPLTWAQWPDAARRVFQGFRSAAGEEMVLQKNTFVEKVLPGSVLRTLSEAEMTVYRRPFLDPGEGRRPTLSWPRQIPIEGEPAEVVKVVEDYGRWLMQSEVPKLFINAEPGAILTGEQREFCRRFRNQIEVTVKGNHFLQEDSPDEIGKAILDWLRHIP